jgi:predicted nucleic acid-binding protein
MSRVFWDTNLYIYLLEDSGPKSVLVNALRKSMLLRGDELITSALTLGEVLVKPASKGEGARLKKYADTITSSSVIVDFDEKAAMKYAVIRSDRTIKAPDAIQLACAAAMGVDLFITNDQRLHSKRVEGIHFIVPLERAPL